MDWTRLCVEVELKNEILLAIQGAISKVGSTDKLKPIKNELPDDVRLICFSQFFDMCRDFCSCHILEIKLNIFVQ